MYKRIASNKVKKINETFRVLLVTGPRQSGKTTLLIENLGLNRSYVSLDDEIVRKQAKENPKLFLEEHPHPLLIDEVQYAPELFSYIKMKVDQVGERGMYWLTGSQQFELMRKVSDSLAGRVGIVKLNSFTYSEIKEKETKIFNPEHYEKQEEIDVNELFELIYKGGMPELYAIEGLDKFDFFDLYVETYISRDVPAILEVKDKEMFKKFMTAMACRNGEPLNCNNIANELGLDNKTITSWVNVLLTSGLIYLLEPFGQTKLSRITHMPKIIFMDSGLCSYLAGWQSAKDLQLSEVAGHYLETYIISDIIKKYNATSNRLIISYYRDKEKNEIDLIMEQNGMIYPFEIKKTANPTKNMIKTFSKLENSNKKIGAGGIICCYDQLMHLDDKHYIIPISSVINIQ